MSFAPAPSPTSLSGKSPRALEVMAIAGEFPDSMYPGTNLMQALRLSASWAAVPLMSKEPPVAVQFCVPTEAVKLAAPTWKVLFAAVVLALML